jgi:acyl CoA:acetate/3-ketoacid CoA transferase
MNTFLPLVFILVLHGSVLDYARSIEAALRETQTKSALTIKTTITENSGVKEGIENIPEKEIVAKIMISVMGNDSKITKLTIEQAKETLFKAHREIMRQALIDATHD